MFELQVRPIDKWPRPFTENRQRGKFTNAYGTIMRGVEKELEYIDARSAVLLMALEPEQIRIDGRPRAGATAKHPGVILVVETDKKGTLRFPCDTYDDWIANIRAISLHLESLRRIDRYGVSVSGEQYTGFAALPSPNGDHRSKEQHAEWIASLLEPNAERAARMTLAGLIITHPAHAEAEIRRAESKTHPDKGGNASDFHQVQQARKALLGDK